MPASRGARRSDARSKDGGHSLPPSPIPTYREVSSSWMGRTTKERRDVLTRRIDEQMAVLPPARGSKSKKRRKKTQTHSRIACLCHSSSTELRDSTELADVACIELAGIACMHTPDTKNLCGKRRGERGDPSDSKVGALISKGPKKGKLASSGSPPTQATLARGADRGNNEASLPPSKEEGVGWADCMLSQGVGAYPAAPPPLWLALPPV